MHEGMANTGDNASSHTKDAEGISHEHKGVSKLEDETLENGENIGGDEGRKSVGEDDGEQVRDPEVGMVFESYDDVSNYYKKYALRVGFAVTVLKSSFMEFGGLCRYLVLACSRGGRGRESANYKARVTAKTDCPAMIVLKLWSDGLLHLVEAKLEHNHTVSVSSARTYKRMSNMVEDSTVRETRSGVRVTRNVPEAVLLKLESGDRDAILRFFGRMKMKNPSFFYLVDLDERGFSRNFFWADARSRSAYRYFSDVILIDSTCLIERYDLPLVLFVGMSHHGQLVLLGCAFLSNDSTETFTWLLKSWLTCMLERQPSAIITDNCKSIQDAVSKIFAGVRHRLCLSHILKKLPEKLKGFSEAKAIKKVLKKAIFDTSGVNDFEDGWKKMIEDYKLDDDEWLNSLYQNRKYWLPHFLKDAFWAGLSISQRGETTNSYFDGCVNPKTSVEEFLDQYETFLESKYRKEMQADADSFHKIQLSSKFYMEEQLLKLYTSTMFRKFQDELKATMYCHTSPIKVEGQVSTFKVKEHSYKEDGKPTESRDYEVTFNTNKLEVQCVCGSFQFKGILCRHVLSVFKIRQVFELPSDYILDRWRRDFKRLHSLTYTSPDGQPNKLISRYDSLCMRLLQLVELGMESDDRYQLALRLAIEAERFLLDDFSGKDRQHAKSSLSSENDSNGSILQLTMGQVLEANRHARLAASGKRRGRPPKHPRELPSNTDTNKEREFLMSSLVESENNMLQISSTPTHVNPHPGIHGGIDLMEDINPTDLSFGTHYGIHVDPHHQHVATQSRPQAVNLEQVHYEQHPPANQARMQWIYHQMLQDDQLPKTPADWRIG